MRYVPKTNATIIAGRVNRPMALKSSDAFHSDWIAAIAAAGSAGIRAVSNSHTGIQNTAENRPHAEKSWRHCQRNSDPKNSTRHAPSVEAGAGANQNSSQRLIAPRITAGPRR